VKQNSDLETLQRDLIKPLAPMFGLTDRDLFSPHITLARIKQKQVPSGFTEFLAQVSSEQSNPIASWTPTAVSLMRSVNGPDGLEYSCIAEFF
jgi:2'-5' RNA ligase